MKRTGRISEASCLDLQKANIVSSDFACDFCTIVDRDRRSEFCKSDPAREKQLVGFGSTEKKNA
jgi:hypothetical protein